MERNLDGVFLINVDQKRFYSISKQFGFGIPVFIIDSYIEDTLFHKIMPDFEQSFALCKTMLGESPEFLIMDSYNHAPLMERIKHVSGLEKSEIYVYEDREGLESFLSGVKEKPGVVMNDFLANEVWKMHKRIIACCTCHCPELLPDAMTKISFDLNDYTEVVHMMNSYIHDTAYVNGEKFFFINVTP
jgi:hypothetical protein